MAAVWPRSDGRRGILRGVAGNSKTDSRTPLRRPNAELRPREHLTEREVGKLIEAAKGNRSGQRDSTMLLIAFRQAGAARPARRSQRS